MGWFYFAPYQLLRIPPGIWRPFTSFFLSTPKLGIILDPYFVYQYLTQLEVASTRFPRKEDLLWYLLTVGTMIIVSCHFPLSSGSMLPLIARPRPYAFLHYKHPQHICPLSAKCSQLKRFLELRKITPALRPVHHSQTKGRLRCGHGGLSYG